MKMLHITGIFKTPDYYIVMIKSDSINNLNQIDYANQLIGIINNNGVEYSSTYYDELDKICTTTIHVLNEETLNKLIEKYGNSKNQQIKANNK